MDEAPKRTGRKPALTPEQAQEVRELYFRANFKVPGIAKMFNATEATIHNVLNRKGAYRHRDALDKGGADG